MILLIPEAFLLASIPSFLKEQSTALVTFTVSSGWSILLCASGAQFIAAVWCSIASCSSNHGEIHAHAQGVELYTVQPAV